MPTHPFFQRLDLAEPTLVALFMGEVGPQKGPHQLPCQLEADHSCSENQHVHIVVFDALMGRVGVMAQARADAVMAGAAYSIKQPRLSLFGEDVLRL